MLTLHFDPADHVVDVHATGALTKQDYDSALPVLQTLMEHGRPWDFLVRIDDFQGWQPRAFWEEARFDMKHRSHFGRIAVVTDSTVLDWAGRISNLFFPREVRVFKAAQFREADAWLRSDRRDRG